MALNFKRSLFAAHTGCPACGTFAAFRRDYSYDKSKVPWYRPAPVQLFCSACGVRLQARLKNSAWAVALVWAAAVAGALVALYAVTTNGYLSARAARLATLFVLGAVAISASLLPRRLVAYTVVGAP
jgi:hypothetical protein